MESRGYTLTELYWEPWYDAGEKSGIGGGWFGTTDRPYAANTYPGNEIMGLSVEEALAWVDVFVKPPDPCACERPSFYDPARTLKGQPQGLTMHDPDCRWHIRYRLPWWPSEQAESAPSEEAT